MKSGYILIGEASTKRPAPRRPAPVTRPRGEPWRAAALLFGAPVAGYLLGRIFGGGWGVRGAIAGGTLGLVGCTVDNPFYAPEDLSPDRRDFGARGGESSPDAGVLPADLYAEMDASVLADLIARGEDLASQPKPDLSIAPDMVTETPDMTSALDLSGPACVSSLAGVGGGDFTIRFRIQTTSGAYSQVLYQRNRCSTAADWWDLVVNSDGGTGRPPGGDGLLTLFINQAGFDYARVSTTVPVNDGRPHDVVIQRRGGTVYTTTDGIPSGMGAAPQALGALPPIGIGRGNPCEPGVAQLVGNVSDVCLTVP